MASAKKVKLENKEYVIISGGGKRIKISPREADEILADLQVMYHMVALGIEENEES